MSSDPRMSKPRLPKAYTDEQLAFLRNHLAEFERRSHGSIRGDAKKFALERSNEFVARFGLPDDFQGVDDPEPRFREQIYNWYKNTVGRARRKLEGRPRSAKKAAEKVAALSAQNTISWNANLASPTTVPYSSQAADLNIASSSQSQQSTVQIQYGGYQPSASMSATNGNIALSVNSTSLRDAFLTPGIEPTTLSALIQSYMLSSQASALPLTGVIQTLFDATTAALSSSSSHGASKIDAVYSLLRRFMTACNYFPDGIVHAGTAGPLAGPRALQMAIRKSSIWVPSASLASAASMTDEMERIATDRQRRKDHIQWAQIHSVALELGLLGVRSPAEPEYAQSLSEMMARDAVWEQDEVEWVAGICVLRAVIRTSSRTQREREGYEQLLRTYEGRWKEIKDEARQALMTEILLSAKEELSRLDVEPHLA